MIVDADCHISPLKEGTNITVDELLRRMDRSGVDKALVWLTPPYQREIDESNAYVHAAVKAHSDRLLGFGWAFRRPGIWSESASRSTASSASNSTGLRTTFSSMIRRPPCRWWRRSPGRAN